MSPLLAWDNFYVIVGSSAGALTGLTFVAITVVAARPLMQGASMGISAYTTPTVVHFGSALFVSALLSAPWLALVQPAIVLGLYALGAVAYSIIVVRRLRRQSAYQPVREDWLWYAALPLIAYVALVVAAIWLPGNPAPALFGIGATLSLLLFIGIHNAWDVVTYIVVEQLNPQNESNKSEV